jgi:CBS domain-containing protein/DNA-directed RNA polymerase subunit RPC12/RpoP
VPGQATAGDIMTSPVITVPPETVAAEVAATLSQHRISAVPVVDAGGALLGLVSEFDLLAKPGASAADLMSTALITVSVACPIEDVRHLLIERRIRRVPVVQDGRLVGIVSRGDLIAAMATEWVCQTCGEPVRAERPPPACPKCGGDSDRFILQEQPPGD